MATLEVHCRVLLGWLALAALAGCQSRGEAARAEPMAFEALAPVAGSAPLPAVVGAMPPAAVVELFTSEGCSSCPAADDNLALLTDEAARSGQRVFTLELHVDYWNYLGWVDPFSDHAHSVRQGAYAQKFAGSGVYTPQLVVNGAEELVGSNAHGSRAAIERALQTPARAQVSLDVRRSPTEIVVSYAVRAAAPVELELALADDSDETQVTRGENSRRLLRHRHVVRAFKSTKLVPPASGSWTIASASAAAHKPLFVAAYATDPSTLAVLGANARDLPALQ
jgi:hypothetical protein